MNARNVRGTLIAVALLALVLRAPLLAALVLFCWGLGELFRVCRRYGRRGYAAFGLVVAAILAFVAYQAYVFWGNRQLIVEIESIGGSRAHMSGRLLPGPVRDILLGPEVGDAELTEILALDGLAGVEYVHADGCRITDQGLLMLRNLKRLNRIYIGVTNATPEGVAELERQLPDCVVVYDPDG